MKKTTLIYIILVGVFLISACEKNKEIDNESNLKTSVTIDGQTITFNKAYLVNTNVQNKRIDKLKIQKEAELKLCGNNSACKLAVENNYSSKIQEYTLAKNFKYYSLFVMNEGIKISKDNFNNVTGILGKGNVIFIGGIWSNNSELSGIFNVINEEKPSVNSIEYSLIGSDANFDDTNSDTNLSFDVKSGQFTINQVNGLLNIDFKLVVDRFEKKLKTKTNLSIAEGLKLPVELLNDSNFIIAE
jgi:hypothetical protein